MSILQHETLPLYEERDGDIVPIDFSEEMAPDVYTNDDFDYSALEAVEVDKRHEGISVKLADRALALESIMSYFNRANRANGLSYAADTMPAAEDIWNRYGNRTPAVVSGATAKVHSQRSTFDRNLDVLAAADALRAAGKSEEYIRLRKIKIQSDLNKDFGVGNAYAKDRADLVKSVKRSTRTILN